MSEQIGEFSLKHSGTTYGKTPEGDIASYANFEGKATKYGTVYGTLKVQTPFAEMGAKKGDCTWIGQGFLEDGTTLGGLGEGAWKQLEGEQRWTVNLVVEISDGTKIRSVGEIDLESLMYTGKIYEIDEALVTEDAKDIAEPA